MKHLVLIAILKCCTSKKLFKINIFTKTGSGLIEKAAGMQRTDKHSRTKQEQKLRPKLIYLQKN